MDFKLNDEQIAIQQTFRKFVNEKVKPITAEAIRETLND